MAYEEVIQNLEAAEAQSGSDLEDFVTLINKYASMGLLIQVNNHVDAEGTRHSLELTYRPSTSVMIRKTITSDGQVSEWKVSDLTDRE